MDKEFMTRMVEGGCPFAKRSGMRVLEVEKGNVSMVLEEDQANLNAFGLVHAGAICGLVETAGGMAIFNHLDPREHMVLNTILNIRFIAMPRGELRCTARVGEDEVRALLDELAAGEKADKSVDLKVLDSSGKTVAQAQATFRLMPTPEEFKKYLGG
jgi:uncharacterized protein (TIGR00369 family)